MAGFTLILVRLCMVDSCEINGEGGGHIEDCVLMHSQILILATKKLESVVFKI